MTQIKTAVSCYSLQDSYARGRLDLPGILDFIASTGSQGVELISDQMIKGTPFPSEETVAVWRTALEKSGLIPVCNDIFINSTIYANRTLRLPEQVELLERDLDVSRRLGFDLVRLVSDTSPEVTLAALPYAESVGVTMALEIHAGMSFSSPVSRQWIDMMKKAQSDNLGLVIDFGIFCQRHPRVATNYFKSIGLSPAVADKIDELYEANGDTMRVFKSFGPGGRYPTELTDLFASPVDAEYSFFSTGYENTPLDVLDEYLPYIRHFHAKFYEMLPDGTEYSIDNAAIITRLNQLGYDGYLSSEYEGNRFVPVDQPVHDQDQVRAHQAMLAAHLNDGELDPLMFDSYVFTANSARNVQTADGGAAFQLETLITYYRGIPLSMVHDIELVVDGTEVPRAELQISPSGEDWFTLDEATTVTTYRWEYGTPLYVRWLNGGLPAGDHQVTLRLKIRVAYIPVPFGGERTRTITV